MNPHVVKQGEHLAKIAQSIGVPARSIWDDPSNRDLRARRKSPEMLLPGDVIFVPDPMQTRFSLDTGTTNRFVVELPTVDVTIHLHDEDGDAIADEPYVVEGLGKAREGRTDASGAVDMEVPIHQRSVTVSLPERGASYEIRVGDMDPVEEPSGVRARLTNLGYLGAMNARGPAREVAFREALRSFQRDHGLAETGTIDRAFRDALVKEHGS